MPRPKAPKLVRTAPPPPNVSDTAENSATTALKKQERRSAPRSSRYLQGRSDVRNPSTLREEKRLDGRYGEQVYMMSGALGEGETATVPGKPPQGRTLANSSRTVKPATRGLNPEKRRRISAQPSEHTGQMQVSSSGPSRHAQTGRQKLGPLAVSSQSLGRRPSLAPKSQEPPLTQSSVLGGIHFKKRARQPSLLQLAQAQHDTGADFDDEDSYDFRPDDESTPLVKSMSQSNEFASSSLRHTSGSRKRKLASPEVQVPASQSEQDLRAMSPEHEDDFTLPPDNGEDTPEPTLPRLRRPRTPSPHIFSDTLAPPRSSSSPTKQSPQRAPRRGPKPKPKPHATTKSRTRNQHVDPESPAASPQSTATASQASPARKAPPPARPLTTARLQNLLPRRRACPKPQGTYDVPSSSDVELDTTRLGEDEDELSFHTTSKARRKRPATGTSKQRAAKGAKESTLSSSKGNRISRTYARKSIVESHSEDDDSGSLVDEEQNPELADKQGAAPVLNEKAKAEMKRLADKFKEVDEYTLDFEDMTGSSSQMRDAR